MSEERKQRLQDSGLVEWSVFSEIVAMDEDEEGFSKSLFETFVDQVSDTFAQIKTELKANNFEKISSLGHYLKGSAAALGLLTISTECERIQNYGHKSNFDNFDASLLSSDSDATPPKENTDEYWVSLIKDALDNAEKGFEKSQKALNEYFSPEEDDD